jgi:PIN domain nuclease of toxin-antitoxin system
MSLLLDTHILLWVLADTKKLSKTSCCMIYEAECVFFSPINLWEIGIKTSIWTEYNIRHVEDIYAGALKTHLTELTVTSADTMLASQLPLIHRDPFDRVLIAQSHNNRCHLLTVDSKIVQYQMPYIIQL